VYKRLKNISAVKITFDQEDKFVKEGKTIKLISGWKWTANN